MKFKLMTDAEVIEAAREDYAYPSSDNIEIDDEPALSRADYGCWVAAWVWVGYEEEEEEEEF